MKNKLTRELYSVLISASLNEKGYETEIDKDGYIRAYSLESNLLIYPSARRLSNKSYVESVMICAESTPIEKLLKRADELAGEYIPCIGFGIGKHSYLDSEICIAPVAIWRTQAESHPVFYISKGKYYFHYARATNKKPEGAILRTIWKAKSIE